MHVDIMPLLTEWEGQMGKLLAPGFVRQDQEPNISRPTTVN